MLRLTATKSFAFRILLVLGLVFATVLATTPAQAYIAVARGTYIVQVKDGSAATVRALISKLGETPHDELTEVMDGFILDLTDSEVAALRADSNVLQVVADQPMSLLDTQSPTPSWGLDRIDQTNTTYDNAYNYPATAGTGVRVYIVDTGVVASDPDFAGRMAPGFDAFGQNLSDTDCNGHGTHVAGTVAGTRYGVAKKATIVPVRVLGCTGSGSWSGFITAMDWIIANHPAGTPGVMNASLGGGKYQLTNDAVQKLFAAGITPVVAAGNENTDSCSRTPASTPNAITVGASTIADARASFSNFGDCVDVFAPGQNIVSNSNVDSSTPRSLSGTSMASPHVAGLAALYLGDNKAASPSDVAVAIQAGAQAGIVVDAKSLNGNYLINTRFTNAALPPVGAPTALVASNIASTSATVSWTAPSGTQAANSYKVEYREASATAFTSVDSATTSASLTSLKGNTTYSVRVSSVSGTTTSPASSELVFTTLGTVADAPSNLRSTSIFGSQVSLAWDAPLNGNGSRITGYEVWVQTAGNWNRQLTTSTTVANVSSLTANTAYSFRVLAVNAIGVSAPSNVLSLTTTAASPTMVILRERSNWTATTITVNWDAVAPIDSATPITYRAVVTNTANNTVFGTFTVATNSIALTGLTRYTIYSMVVTAFSGTVAGRHRTHTRSELWPMFQQLRRRCTPRNSATPNSTFAGSRQAIAVACL
jgi:subtilisin family serine protease